jgi:hypothetical protein
MKNNARMKLHNVKATDDMLIPKNNRPLLWKPSKKQTKRKSK